MICTKCGHQNLETSKFCAACGSPLQKNEAQNPGKAEAAFRQLPDYSQPYGQGQQASQGGPAGYSQSMGQSQPNGQGGPSGYGQPGGQGQPPFYGRPAGQSGGGKEPCDIALMVLSLVYAFLYVIRAVRSIPTIYYCLKNVFRGYVPLAFQLHQLCSVVLNIMIIVSCVAFAYVLVLFAARRTRENVEQLYMGVVGAAVLRIAVALAHFLLYAVFSFSIRLYYSPLTFGKTFLYAAVTAGSLLGILYLSGMKPFAGKNKEELLAMAKGLWALLQDETMNIFAGIKAWKADSQGRKESYVPGQGAAQGGFLTGMDVSGGAMAGSGAPGGGFAGGVSGGGFAGGGAPGGGMPMKTDRSLFLVLIFSFLTCGIYYLYFAYTMARDINIICEGDGEKTAGIFELIVFSLLTCGIYSIVWDYKFEDRLMRNGPRYGVMIGESGSTVLLWRLFGVFLCGLGLIMVPYIQIKNLNYLSRAYNEKNH